MQSSACRQIARGICNDRIDDSINGLTYRVNGEKGKNMECIYSLVKLFGERYIFCDAEQALLDCQNREELVAAFAAIMEYIRAKSDK